MKKPYFYGKPFPPTISFPIVYHIKTDLSIPFFKIFLLFLKIFSFSTFFGHFFVHYCILKSGLNVRYFENVFYFHFPFKEKKDNTSKKPPNAFLNHLDGKYADKSEPPNATKSAEIITGNIPFGFKSPFFACVFKANKLIGKKENKFAHCATFWGVEKRRSKGIVTVPPPIPIPAGTPPKNPSTT